MELTVNVVFVCLKGVRYHIKNILVEVRYKILDVQWQVHVDIDEELKHLEELDEDEGSVEGDQHEYCGHTH